MNTNSNLSSEDNDKIQRLIALSKSLGVMELQEAIIAAGLEIFIIPKENLHDFLLQIMANYRVTAKDSCGLLTYHLEKKS
jgi:hypothetical protein